MSTPAHVILEFGNTRVELYRHWGGSPVVTGNDLLQKISDAPSVKERGHFHDGGYILRLMLEDSDGSLPQYQIVDGLMGQNWEHGYHLKFVPDEQNCSASEVTIHDPSKGYWEIRYSKLEGHETSDEWVQNVNPMTVDEFTTFVNQCTNNHIENGGATDLDAKGAFLRSLKRKD